MIAASLISATGVVLVPAFYMIFAASIALLALALTPDRSRTPLR